MLSVSQLDNSKEQKQPRWHLIYYLLATFDLITVSITLFLSFTILGIYSQSVDDNNTWAKRAGSLSDLSQVLIKVNTPGNDVFESDNPNLESDKLATYHQEFTQLYESIIEDMRHLDDRSLMQNIQRNMREVSRHETNILNEARDIFSNYKQGKRAVAGNKMAIMDQHFAKASASLAKVNNTIRNQQDLLLKAEIAKAKELSRYEYLIVGLILLMICGVFIYGKTLAKKMAQSEETIRSLLARNKGILQTCSDGIITTNEQGVIETANPACETIFGYSANALCGKNMASLILHDRSDSVQTSHPALFGQLVSQLSRLVSKSGLKCQGINQDGQTLPLHLDIGQMQLQGQSQLSYVVTFRDIREQDLLEQALLSAKNKAETANSAKGRFLANMSHEIRTPMNGVLGMLGLLHDEKMAEKQQHYVNLAQYSANSLLVLINDILDFSKIESGKLDLEIIDFDLKSQLNNFVKSMAFQSEEKGLELVLDVSDVQSSFVRGDPGRILQILTNVVGNSIKFTSQGEISIVAKTQVIEADGLLFSIAVTDTGVGIEPEKAKSIFETFTQADASTTREFGGTGLGLSISKQLCKLMDGEISVSSELGQGSVFSFTLKLQTSWQSDSNLSLVNIDRKRLLIVDDNKTNLAMMQSQLMALGGDVTLADSGKQALDILRDADDGDFEGAFIDRNMPDMDGDSLVKEIHKFRQHLPVILMTSLAYPEDASHFASLGILGHFAKPVTTKDIHKAIDTLFAEHQTISPLLPTPLTTLETKSPPVDADNGPLKASGNEPKILLVEDNPINQMVVLAQLNALGLSADVSGNGVEAIKVLKNASAPYNLLLMDCQMPEMDGYETTAQIRAGVVDSYDDITIIAMTANAMKGDKERCLDCGMNDYIPKPIEPSFLIEKLQLWLGAEHVIPQNN